MTTKRHNDIWRRDFYISTSLYNDISIRKWRPANIAVAFLLAAAMLLTGCGGSDSFDDQPQNVAEGASPQEITIKTDITSMQTRATTIDDDEDLQGEDLRIDAYLNGTTTECIGNAKLKYITSAWKFVDGSDEETHYFWPIEGSVLSGNTVGAIDFVGYCPHTTPGYISSKSYSAGNPSIVCDMSDYMTSTAQDGVTEFMWAYTGNQTKDTNSGTVNMNFKHPFTCIKFQLAENHPDITINTITLEELKSGGTCSFNGSTSSWSSLTPADKTVDFVGSYDLSLSSNVSVQAIGNPFIVVPQTFGGKIKVKATWTKWDEQVAHTISTTLPSPVNWQAGYCYTYTFTITETDLIVKTDKYTEQW